MGIAHNVEVWIVGAFGALVLAACLDGPRERAAPAVRTPPVETVADTGLAQPHDAAQPTYVVYVVGKRPGAAGKRKAGERAG